MKISLHRRRFMNYKKFGNIWVISLDAGEEVVESLCRFCRDNKIMLGAIIGIGATDNAVIGIYDTAKRAYKSTMIEGDHEITNITGNISRMENDVYLHIHATLSDVENFTIGGHLTSAVISGGCELFVTAIDAEITRVFNEKTGLYSLKF